MAGDDNEIFSEAVLDEWDQRLDAMEELFGAAVMLGDPYQEQVDTARHMRKLLLDVRERQAAMRVGD
jgi:hypothetical protein